MSITVKVACVILYILAFIYYFRTFKTSGLINKIGVVLLFLPLICITLIVTGFGALFTLNVPNNEATPLSGSVTKRDEVQAKVHFYLKHFVDNGIVDTIYDKAIEKYLITYSKDDVLKTATFKKGSRHLVIGGTVIMEGDEFEAGYKVIMSVDKYT